MKRNSVIVAVVCLVIGFAIGRFQGPEKVETTETVETQREMIQSLQARIQSLSQENLKENVKTVVVEKPDGTKITTNTRLTEKQTNRTQLSTSDSSLKENVESKSKKETVTTFSSNRNSFGVRGSYLLPRTLDAEAYVKAGMKCFILNCYVVCYQTVLLYCFT